MKYVVMVQIPIEHGNAMVKEPGFVEKIQSILSFQKAESVYFGMYNGHRTAFYVTDIADASKIPSVTESWWLWLNAKIDLVPVMTPQDLGKAMPDLANCVKTFG